MGSTDPAFDRCKTFLENLVGISMGDGLFSNVTSSVWNRLCAFIALAGAELQSLALVQALHNITAPLMSAVIFFLEGRFGKYQIGIAQRLFFHIHLNISLPDWDSAYWTENCIYKGFSSKDFMCTLE